jgi:hypothetical protein
LKVYPNPCTGQFQVGGLSEVAIIEILDINGSTRKVISMSNPNQKCNYLG